MKYFSIAYTKGATAGLPEVAAATFFDVLEAGDADQHRFRLWVVAAPTSELREPLMVLDVPRAWVVSVRECDDLRDALAGVN